MKEIIEKIKHGAPIYVKPYEEPKVWGVNGIGEFWYGAEDGEKSSTARVEKLQAALVDIVKEVPEDVLGKEVIEKFGKNLPLVKILTPKGRLSVQFHDAKNELWIITGIDKSVAWEVPSVILGFSSESVEMYGDQILDKYKDALIAYGDALNSLIDVLIENGFEEVLEEKKML